MTYLLLLHWAVIYYLAFIHCFFRRTIICVWYEAYYCQRNVYIDIMFWGRPKDCCSDACLYKYVEFAFKWKLMIYFNLWYIHSNCEYYEDGYFKKKWSFLYLYLLIIEILWGVTDFMNSWPITKQMLTKYIEHKTKNCFWKCYHVWKFIPFS